MANNYLVSGPFCAHRKWLGWLLLLMVSLHIPVAVAEGRDTCLVVGTLCR